ncbi:hypothetical protein QJ527_11985 [Enterococcus mundtii]|nr:hypothetical protein [Enterococcus mundtii]MDA9427735.1 hypothetical protein [Enterococcus mundtii 1A]MDK4212254.1 hypothetical protein [Enterococcus mundtii]MDO7879285.1 hypothetical protein [Enterococcus mundtii]
MTITDKKVSEMERLQAVLQPEIQEIWKKRKNSVHLVGPCYFK